MLAEPESPFLRQLRNRIDLVHIPFTDRASRMMLFRSRQGAEPDAPPADTFFIRLAERWVKQESVEGHYRQRQPIVRDLAWIGPNGEPLPFELTTYPHKVIFSTPQGPAEAAFLDMETLYFSLPAQPIGLHFQVKAEHGQADRRGGTFHGVRNTAYTLNVPLLRNTVTPLPDGYLDVTVVSQGGVDAAMLLNISPRLGYNRSVPASPPAVLGAAEHRWHDWFAAAPPVLEEYQRQYYYAWWVMRAGLISPRYYMTREGMTPSKIHYVGVWQWDALFHALAYRYVEPHLAEDQLRLLLDHQRADGMLPDAVHDEGIITHLSLPVDADVTKPPLAAWTALKVFELSGHRDFLDEVYEPLVRWNNFWFEQRGGDQSGLCHYNHPFSSGLDDSPLWDEGMPVESPDLNTYLYLQLESLARIAEIIGEKKDVSAWREKAARLLQQMLDQMWDEQAGLFWALHVGSDGAKSPVRVVTPFSLYPLWTGRLPGSISERLLKHLQDPAEFWTRYPLPTVARNDPKYDPFQMWRGPTWVNVNYLFCEGLERIGVASGGDTLAQELRRRTLELIMRHEDIFEYYHPETGVHPPKAAPIFGWTSALFIDLAIQASQSHVAKVL